MEDASIVSVSIGDVISGNWNQKIGVHKNSGACLKPKN
jgi:hypothetical protein